MEGRWSSTAKLESFLAPYVTNLRGSLSRPPTQASGIRIGTLVVTRLGMRESEMKQVSDLMDTVLKGMGDDGVTQRVLLEIQELRRWFPLPSRFL